jgi:hypothetical protein
VQVLCDAVQVEAIAEVEGRGQREQRIEGYEPRVAHHFVCCVVMWCVRAEASGCGVVFELEWVLYVTRGEKAISREDLLQGVSKGNAGASVCRNNRTKVEVKRAKTDNRRRKQRSKSQGVADE